MTRCNGLSRSTLLVGLAATAACTGDDTSASAGSFTTSADATTDATFGEADDGDDGDDDGDDGDDDGMVDTTGDGADSESGTPDDTASSQCGDSIIEGDEACDSGNLGGEDCTSLGFDGGTLGCNGLCTELDTSECVTWECGNDTVEGDEVCDGTDTVDDCRSLGFDAGDVVCADDCSELDASGCITFSCGNDTTEGREVCDGTDLDGEDCLSLDFDGGELSCADGCAAFDTSACTTCGDDTTEGDEVCDGSDLGKQTCIDEGFGDGVLGCDSDCGGYDTSSCNTCGNTTVEGLEVCDGPDLDGATCVSEGFDTGVLGCQVSCDAFDVSGCCNGDDIGSAVGAAVASGTNAGGGDDSVGECDGSAGPDVVYFWTAPDTGLFNIDTLGSNYDTVLYVLDDCGGAELACADESFSTSQSSVELDATEGTEYAIVVDGWDGATGEHVLNISASPAACTDDAIGSSLGAVVSTGDNAGNGDDYSLSACTLTSGQDVAISWVAPRNGHFQFDTIGSTYDTVLGLYDTCGGALLTCDDQSGGGGGQSLLTHAVTAGVPYIVVVDGWNNASGTYNLNITPQLSACNDEDVGAAVGLDVGSASTVGAGDDTQPGCTATTGEDIAFQWTAPTTDNYRINTFGSDFDTVLSVRDGCGGAELVCNNQAGGGDQSQVTLAATAGTTYSIVVDGFGETGNVALSIRPLPSACVDAPTDAPFGPAIAGGSNIATGDDEQTGCTATAGEDLVYQWIAPASGTYALDTLGSSYDTVLEVRTSCDSALLCNDQADGVGPHAALEFDATAGVSYLFVVDAWNGTTGNHTVNINGPY